MFLLNLTIIQLVSQNYIVENETSPYFPNQNGSEWIYSRLNEFNNKTDTITVRIVSDTIIENAPFKVWQYDFNTNKESLYYSDRQDTITVLNNLFYVVQQYILPIKVGNNYKFSDFNENPTYYRSSRIRVLHRHEVMIGRKNFMCYLLLHKGTGYNDYLTEKIWFKEKIGIVKLESHCWSLGCNKNQTWKLIGCIIK